MSFGFSAMFTPRYILGGYNVGRYWKSARQFRARAFLPFEYLLGVTISRSSTNRIQPEFISNIKGKILEIGGYNATFKEPFREGQYLNLDLQDGPTIDIVENAENAVSLQDDQFDAVVCCSVIEHTHNPEKIIDEIVRVTKSGGLVLISAPWLFESHMSPNDFRRFSLDYYKSLINPKLEITKIECTNGYFGLLSHFLQRNIFLRFTLGFLFRIISLFEQEKHMWATQITITAVNRKPKKDQ